MGVQTQIDRLTSAKTAIGTAIAGKGVTVPDGTKLDGMAALIDSIEVGGSTTAYTVYIGTAEPTADIGNDGDIYIVRTVTA